LAMMISLLPLPHVAWRDFAGLGPKVAMGEAQRCRDIEQVCV